MLQRLTVRLQADDRGADNEFTTHAYTLRRSFTAATLVLVTAVLSARHSSAQSPTLTLPLSLFERYLESLRVEAGIPGISAAILQNGGIIWERGFGRQDVEASIAATPSTPYLIGGLSQTIGATLLLRKCVDERFMELSDRVNAWSPGFPEPATTIRDLLTHRAPFGGYQYSPTRFAALTPVIEQCSSARYSQVLVEDVFERLAMTESAPVHAVEALAPPDAAVLGPKLAHYVGLLQRLAVPYQVHVRDRTISRTPMTAGGADAAGGVVSTVRDLARFDADLSAPAPVLLSAETRRLAWIQATPLPTGFGWFVQAYNDEPIVWQFGMVRDAYSSLIVKVPNRGLTLILLANSDGLSAPFGLERGDVTASLYARVFLRLMVI